MRPTQRTLKHVRGAGYPLVQVVERWSRTRECVRTCSGSSTWLAVGVDIVGVQAHIAAFGAADDGHGSVKGAARPVQTPFTDDEFSRRRKSLWRGVHPWSPRQAR